MHVHSSASFDCNVPPGLLAERCCHLGLTPIFLTDHDTTSGCLLLGGAAKYRVVAGEEITTVAGEVIGLFLSRPIPAGLSARQTAMEIKNQGGLVYLEHSYDQSRRHLREDAIEELSDLIDIVEVVNGRSDDRANRRAADLRDTLGVAAGAGSDAHTLAELGSVFVEMDDFDGAQDFLAKLRLGRIVTRRSKLLLMARALVKSRIRRL